MDITNHYTFVNDCELFQSVADARIAAEGDDNRIWFVRHGDGCEHLDNEEDCECEETWDVELYRGQFVNCAGFFVSLEPCEEIHKDTTFTY